MGVVIDGSLYRGWTNRAGEFRSVLYSGSSFNGQLALTNENLIALETDEHLQKAFMKELLSNLFSAEAIINPRTIFLGGDLVKKHWLNVSCKQNFLQWEHTYRKKRACFILWMMQHGT